MGLYDTKYVDRSTALGCCIELIQKLADLNSKQL